MPIKIHVKSTDPVLKARREATVDRVTNEFKKWLPDCNLLCFFDDEDCQALRNESGQSNRGVFARRAGTNPRTWPKYVRESLGYDFHLIYLHGTTCAYETGMIMTFAHELQHFVQYSTVRPVWAANVLIPKLHRSIIKGLRLKWADVPYECEARIISKRVAETLRGVDPVGQYINAKINAAAGRNHWEDKRDWEFIRQLDPGSLRSGGTNTAVFSAAEAL